MLAKRTSVVAALVVGAFAAGCSKARAQRPFPSLPVFNATRTDEPSSRPPPDNNDEALARAVKHKLTASGAVPGGDLHITVQQGTLTLAGRVSKLVTKLRAIHLGESVEGVRSIRDQVEVDPVLRSDQDIAGDVQRHFADAPALAGCALRVSVDNGVVTLLGTVRRWPLEAYARRIATRADGVRRVIDAIAVAPPSRAADEIKKDVLRALRWDTHVDERPLSVWVEDGMVVISGVTGTLAELRRIRTKAWVLGVRDVSTSGIRIAPKEEQTYASQPRFVPASDDDIANEIQLVLTRDPRLHRYDISSAVSGGHVILRGLVQTAAEKRAAAMIARDTAGVVGVDNHIGISAHVPDVQPARACAPVS